MHNPHATSVWIAAESPCQDMSVLNVARAGLGGSRCKLFWEILRVQRLVQDEWPETKILLMVENVASMDDSSRDTISNAVGVQPVSLDARCFCAARRPRLYWMLPRPTAPWRAASHWTAAVETLSPAVEQGPHARWLDTGAQFTGDELPTFVRCTPRRSPLLCTSRNWLL